MGAPNVGDGGILREALGCPYDGTSIDGSGWGLKRLAMLQSGRSRSNCDLLMPSRTYCGTGITITRQKN